MARKKKPRIRKREHPTRIFGPWAMAKQTDRTYRQYAYARETVPPSAKAVVLYYPETSRMGKRWYWITPAFAYEPGAWRVSYIDERGPMGHEVADWHGRPFMTKYDAIMDVLGSVPRARIVEYIDASGRHIRIGSPRTATPNPTLLKRAARRRKNR